MLAAAGRESHRSPSERRLLSPETRTLEEGSNGEAGSMVGTIAGSVVDGGGAASGGGSGGGLAALESDVGDVDSLMLPPPPEARKREQSKGKGGVKDKEQSLRGRSAVAGTGKGTISTSARGGKAGAVTAAAAAAVITQKGAEEQDDVAKTGDEGKPGVDGGGDGAGDGARMNARSAAKRLSTERTQQMYETHRQTQVYSK